jgi:hypothetical protein
MYCKSCGKECLAEAVACTGCGVPPHKGTKFCQSCGEGTNDEAIMCVKCGASLKKSSSIDLSGSADSVGEMKDKLVSSFNNFSNEKKISVGGAAVMIISALFLNWFSSGGFSATLFSAEESIHAIILAACAGASLFLNFKDDSEKAKYAALGAIGYVFAWIFIFSDAGSDFFDFAGIGFYLFVVSAGASAYFSHKESN